MSKILEVNKIISDAYQQAFVKLESAQFLESEKLLDFTVGKLPNENVLMNDYAYVIIYSNTGRVDLALEKCQDILSSSEENIELKTVVHDIYNQLRSTYEIRVPNNRKSKYPEGYITLLLEVKPENPQNYEIMIESVSESDHEAIFLNAFYNGETLEDFDQEKENFSLIFEECIMIEELLAGSDQVLETKTHIAADLHQLFLSDSINNHYTKFMYLHAKGLISQLLRLNVTPIPVKNTILYNVCRLFEYDLIDNINLEINFKGEVYRSTISDYLTIFYEGTVESVDKIIKKLYKHPGVELEFNKTVDEVLELLYSLTFPSLVADKKNIKPFVIAILYFVSTQEYASEYHQVIKEIYNVGEDELTDELNLIEVLINL